MKLDELEKMAQQTAAYGVHPSGEFIYSFYTEQLQAFAKLIAEHERKWVGLTNEEITDLYHNENLGQQSAVAQAMALLKERNT
ncbi:hypothetical protein CCP3SC1AL1_1440007 [Gammaproteobacteria bacterium]